MIMSIVSKHMWLWFSIGHLLNFWHCWESANPSGRHHKITSSWSHLWPKCADIGIKYMVCDQNYVPGIHRMPNSKCSSLMVDSWPLLLSGSFPVRSVFLLLLYHNRLLTAKLKKHIKSMPSCQWHDGRWTQCPTVEVQTFQMPWLCTEPLAQEKATRRVQNERACSCGPTA